MGEKTNIAWTDATANFWIGCTRVAQGCVNCYAETFARRVGADVWGRDKPRRYVKGAAAMCHKMQRQAAEQPRRQRVFVSSLCDFFDDGTIPVVDYLGRPIYRDPQGSLSVALDAGRPLQVEDLREMAWQVIDACPDVDFLILTKRPEAVRSHWYNNGARRANVWLGVSAATDPEYVRAMQQLNELRDLARYTFISAEPLVENIRPRLDGYGLTRPPHWVIVGGESGAGARPCRIAWIREFVRAREHSPHGAKLFVKQLGSRVADAEREYSPKGGDPTEWPAGLCVREFPGSDV